MKSRRIQNMRLCQQVVERWAEPHLARKERKGELSGAGRCWQQPARFYQSFGSLIAQQQRREVAVSQHQTMLAWAARFDASRAFIDEQAIAFEHSAGLVGLPTAARAQFNAELQWQRQLGVACPRGQYANKLTQRGKRIDQLGHENFAADL